jgi:hypothetical protein
VLFLYFIFIVIPPTTKIDFQLQNYLPTCRLLIRPLLENIGGYHYLKINPESIGMSPWYFFSRHFKCRGIFQKYNGRWENTMSKNRL